MNRIIRLLFLLLCPSFGVAAADADPFSDKQLTCAEVRLHPEVFGSSIDLGSGSGSPNKVEFDCPERLDKLEFLRDLQFSAGAIRGGKPQRCQGSSQYALARYQLWEALGWGLAPRELAKISARVNRSQYPSEAPVWKYLQRWAYNGLYQFEAYTEFVQAHATAIPPLAAHYTAELKMQKEEAHKYATWALMYYVNMAGGYPRQSNAVFVDWNSEDALSQFLETANSNQLLLNLKAAILENQPIAVLDKIIERLPNPNQGDETALHVSVRSVEITKYLIDRGLSVDYENIFGKTPLFYAVERNLPDVTKLLIASGANVHKTYEAPKVSNRRWLCDYDIHGTGRSVLMHASQHASPELLEVLLRAGAQIEIEDDLGKSAIDYAIQSRNDENAKYLMAWSDSHPSANDS